MSLVKWGKEEDLFPSFFDDFFGKDLMSSVARGTSIPAVNISETGDDYVVEVAAPGMSKEDFKVNLDNEILTISAEKKEETDHNEEGRNNQNKKVTRKEFSFTSFQRSFSLPDVVDASRIDATYNNGILKLTLPKREEARKQPPREIPIN